jgi:hypothetical protein
VRKGSVELKERLQHVLVPMFCHAANSAPEDKKAKLEKVTFCGKLGNKMDIYYSLYKSI